MGRVVGVVIRVGEGRGGEVGGVRGGGLIDIILDIVAGTICYPAVMVLNEELHTLHASFHWGTVLREFCSFERG